MSTPESYVITLAALSLPLLAGNPPEEAVEFRGAHYQLITETTDWRSAKERCEKMGGRLVCVHNKKVQEFVARMAGGKRVWIGLTDQVTEGVWTWVDGTPLKFSAWGDQQPDSAHDDEDFVNLRPDGTWNDAILTGPSEQLRVLGFICEWPASAEKAAKEKKKK